MHTSIDPRQSTRRWHGGGDPAVPQEVATAIHAAIRGLTIAELEAVQRCVDRWKEAGWIGDAQKAEWRRRRIAIRRAFLDLMDARSRVLTRSARTR